MIELTANENETPTLTSRITSVEEDASYSTSIDCQLSH